jgi:hypothetical protein
VPVRRPQAATPESAEDAARTSSTSLSRTAAEQGWPGWLRLRRQGGMAGHGGGGAPDPVDPLLAVSSAVAPPYAPRFPDRRRKRGLEGWPDPMLPPSHPWPAARGHGRARRDGQAQGRRPGSTRPRPSSVCSGLHLGLAAGLLRLRQDLGRRVHGGWSGDSGSSSLSLSLSHWWRVWRWRGAPTAAREVGPKGGRSAHPVPCSIWGTRAWNRT